MRIFPEGMREWIKPVGQVFLILAAGMFLVALSVFCWKTWKLERWARTVGTIVSARVETSMQGSTAGERPIKTCSAVYTVRYSVHGKEFTTESGGHSFTSDCTSIESAVKVAPGRSVVALYDRDDPGGAYIDPGFNVEYFLVPFILSIMALVFGIAGSAAWKLGSRLDRKGFEFL
jgi:hypothetical protein